MHGFQFSLRSVKFVLKDVQNALKSLKPDVKMVRKLKTALAVSLKGPHVSAKAMFITKGHSWPHKSGLILLLGR